MSHPGVPATLRAVESEPGQREPVVHEKTMTATVGVKASVTTEVERGLNGIRLAVLGIVVGIALTVAFGVEVAWWVRVLLGVGTFALTCFLFWWRPVRSVLMAFMYRITGA